MLSEQGVQVVRSPRSRKGSRTGSCGMEDFSPLTINRLLAPFWVGGRRCLSTNPGSPPLTLVGGV